MGCWKNRGEDILQKGSSVDVTDGVGSGQSIDEVFNLMDDKRDRSRSGIDYINSAVER